MPLKVRLLTGSVLVILLGGIAGELYASCAAPLFALLTRWLVHGHPWQVLSVDLISSGADHGRALRLTASVHRHLGDPGALVVQRLQIGEVIETFAVFWPMLLLWPTGSGRQRLSRCLVGIPVYLLLEAATTAVQLVHNLPQAAAMLEGESDPLTVWERYSRFLEQGGRFAIEVCGALIAVSIANFLSASHPAHASNPAAQPPGASIQGSRATFQRPDGRENP